MSSKHAHLASRRAFWLSIFASIPHTSHTSTVQLQHTGWLWMARLSGEHEFR